MKFQSTPTQLAPKRAAAIDAIRSGSARTSRDLVTVASIAGRLACENVHFATRSRTANVAQTGALLGLHASLAKPSLVTRHSHSIDHRNIARPAISHTYKRIIESAVSKYSCGRGRKRPVLLTKLWQNLLDDEKLQRILHYALLLESFAFNLNFKHARAKALLGSQDAKKRFADEINRQAKKLLGGPLAYLFVFEFDPDGRLHCHGTALIDDHSAKSVGKLREVLKRAAGKIEGDAAKFQLRLKPLASIAADKTSKRSRGWDNYLFKDARRTMDILNGGAIYGVSRAMAYIAKRHHDQEVRSGKLRRRMLKQRPVQSVRRPSILFDRARTLRQSVSCGVGSPVSSPRHLSFVDNTMWTKRETASTRTDSFVYGSAKIAQTVTHLLQFHRLAHDSPFGLKRLCCLNTSANSSGDVLPFNYFKSMFRPP